MVFLAINYGSYEGWTLTEYLTGQDALNAVRGGESYGNEWKILKELQITVHDDVE